MIFCLCMCLLGVWFIGAPTNITVWVRLPEISHGNTCTSDAMTSKYTYICVCVLEQNSMKNRNPMKHVNCQKTFFEILHFLSVFETLNTNGFDIITRTFHALLPLLFFFPHWKMQRHWKYFDVFWSPFTCHTAFHSKKAGKQENLKWNIGRWKCS